MPYCDQFLLRRGAGGGGVKKQNKKNSTKYVKLGEKFIMYAAFLDTEWTAKEVVGIFKFIYVKTNLIVCPVDVGFCDQNTWEINFLRVFNF